MPLRQEGFKFVIWKKVIVYLEEKKPHFTINILKSPVCIVNARFGTPEHFFSLWSYVNVFHFYGSLPNCPHLPDRNLSTATHVAEQVRLKIWKEFAIWSQEQRCVLLFCLGFLFFLGSYQSCSNPRSKHSLKRKPSERFIAATFYCFEETGCYSCCIHSSCLEHK